MKKIFMWILLILATSVPSIGQTLQLPWWVASGGGSTSTVGSLTLTSSVAQPLPANPLTVGSLTLEGGYIPGIRVLAGATSTFAQQAASGWNMVSVPLLVSDYHKTTLYPGAASVAYFYSGGYAIATTLANGAGYWLQYSSSSPVSITGTAFMAETLQVLQNWNMIGPPSYPILRTGVVGVGTSILSHFFGYQSGFGYVLSDTLYPGNAYWVQVSANGTLILPSGGLSQTSIRPSVVSQAGENHSAVKSLLLSSEQQEEVKSFNVISFRDASGSQRLVFYSDAKSSIDLKSYTLPPVAPDNLMDVRFASQRIVEIAGQATPVSTFPMHLSGGAYPITVTWDGKAQKSNDALVLIDAAGGKHEYALSTPGHVTINDPESVTGMRLRLDGSSTKAIPKEFALYQNYPNPFNPSTTIRYDVPKFSRVILRVYNILGEEVSTLVNEDQDAGTYEVRLNADRFSSGIYFYRFEAGSVVFTKKLVLMK
jgi:hypothetical protein